MALMHANKVEPEDMRKILRRAVALIALLAASVPAWAQEAFDIVASRVDGLGGPFAPSSRPDQSLALGVAPGSLKASPMHAAPGPVAAPVLAVARLQPAPVPLLNIDARDPLAATVRHIAVLHRPAHEHRLFAVATAAVAQAWKRSGPGPTATVTKWDSAPG